MLVALPSLLVLLSGPGNPVGAESVCRGTTANGALENGCKLPSSGANFSSYSHIGSFLGRTYVHCTVSEILRDSYSQLEQQAPGTRFVYGETGFARGGPFKPHKTHQNGLSVDFFVPVRDANRTPVDLPTHALNKWGYDIEFDSDGGFDGLTIDFEAMAAHILALHRVAQAHGVGIWRVIFDPRLQPKLHKTKAWPELKGKVTFSERPSWVRHDEHYHVDFQIPCDPM